MEKATDQDDLMLRYLLGEMTEEEQTRMEEQYFANDDSYQQLLALEDELKYEYAQGGLTPQQRTSFEKRFLVSTGDREKVALAGAVLDKVYEVRAEAERVLATAPARRERAAWWQPLANIFAIRSPGMQFAFAAASMVMLVGGSWFMFQNVQLQNRIGALEAQRRAEEQQARQQTTEQRTQQEQLRQELARERDRRSELERQLGGRPASTSFLSFVLVPGLVRDAEGPKRLAIPADTGEARLQLDVKGKGPYKTYRAELQTVEGEQIWSQNVAQPMLAVPARLLVPGDYVVVLKGLTPQGELEPVGEFYFVAVRK